jgi:hypothetical protein
VITDKDIVTLEYNLIRTQLILDHIVNNTPNIEAPSNDNMKDIDREALESIQKKYPDMGISR